MKLNVVLLHPTVRLCSKAMPVAVDTTPEMAASKPKKAAPQPHEIPLPDTPKSTKKSRKKQAPVEPIPGSSKPIEATSWSWRSLTDHDTGRASLLFTKDGR